MAMGFFAKLFGADTAVDAVKSLGSGVSNLLDRFIPKKMSEHEKWQKTESLMQMDIQREGLEVEDVNKARDMWMTFLKTQKLPWIARLLNGLLRPVAGWIALIYLTDKWWGPLLDSFFTAYTWKPIDRDPVVDVVMGGILGFFFGFRHRAKTKGVTAVG